MIQVLIILGLLIPAIVAAKYGGRILDLYVFLAFDYAQAEIRMLAQISGDQLLIDQLNSGQDIHSLIGHTLTGWSVERIKTEKNLRKMVKNMVFGVIFGLQRDNLYPYVVTKIRQIDGENADLTGITPERVGKLYDAFFKKYKGVARYIENQRRKADEDGFVETLFGFRSEVRADDETRDTYYGNQAVNRPIQGSAHQFLLIAMAMLHLKPVTYNKLQIALMEIHDALVFRVRVRDLPKAYRQGKQLLERGVIEYAERHFGVKMKVPMIAEGSAGFCFGSMVDYEGGPVEEFIPAWREKHLKVEATSWEKLTKGAA